MVLTNKKGNTILSQYSYTYYLDGNQQSKTDHLGNVTTYTYDDLGSLESEDLAGEDSITYTYDDANNRETKTVLNESVSTYDYDAFGIEKAIDESDLNPFRYCGEYYDRETGTYYLRARYYNPVIGRFTSPDSYMDEARDPLSLNLNTCQV